MDTKNISVMRCDYILQELGIGVSVDDIIKNGLYIGFLCQQCEFTFSVIFLILQLHGNL